MKTLKNYSDLLLDPKDRDKFRILSTEKYSEYKAAVYAWLVTLASDTWIDFLLNVNEKKRSLLIKLICLFIYDQWKENDSFEFNSTVTLLRRRKDDYTEIQNPSSTYSYQKGRGQTSPEHSN